MANSTAVAPVSLWAKALIRRAFDFFKAHSNRSRRIAAEVVIVPIQCESFHNGRGEYVTLGLTITQPLLAAISHDVCAGGSFGKFLDMSSLPLRAVMARLPFFDYCRRDVIKAELRMPLGRMG
jgi:hypothetical protein